MSAPAPLGPEPLLRNDGLVTRINGDGPAVTPVDANDQ